MFESYFWYSTQLVLCQYLHDGTDTTSDHIQLMARTAGVDWPEKDKTSVAANLKIIVQPVSLHFLAPVVMFGWSDGLKMVSTVVCRLTTQFRSWSTIQD